ncbi:hypothetical protein Poli38472_002225 [Pythium oligandrum]|uniref:VLRF1 domain-containing protein n=1 Tax=Pythium oligandrum TaxID=41045 RepID=A0A8K1FJM6_PYTOL|nr:hypothetical protein Poli38472_002225 [Pythium oligandrum]|eukprot:TMW63284.1 hypothetical protein Poli38472_002225 [Pythium oligandrum]
MGKKVRFEGDRAYGRIGLSELSDERVAEWTVRAVAGETRRFERQTADAPTVAMDRLAIQTAIDQRSRPAVGLRCGTCDIVSFASLDEQYAHFKSDWHCANLKRKAKGAVILSEVEYSNASASKAHEHAGSSSDSSSSTSSSEEEEENEAVTTAEPVVEFSDGKSIFKVFKNILPNADTESFEPFSALDHVRQSKFRWAVFLLRSGRFAGAVFDKEKALCHKTFQRYTTRRKQGGSQAAHDASGGKAKSAGATLRRYNEAQLKQDVADLLAQWKDLLKDVELIFIACGRTDRPTFFGGKPPVLQADDSRLRRIPFATFRPTFEEVCRVRSELSSVKFAPIPVAASPVEAKTGRASASRDAQEQKIEIKADAEVGKAEEEPVVLPPLSELVRSGTLAQVKSFVEETQDIDVNVVDTNFMSALHHAVELNATQVVQYLLEHGANPSLLDLRSRPPYFLCTSKEMRNAFRRYMAANPDAWDYSASQIPSGLTDDMEQKKKEKEAEKRRRARERKKQQKKDEAEQKQKEEEAKAEQERKVAAGLACDFCGKYAGKSPFKRLEYKYCSTDCVNNHRRKLMSEAALKRLGG